MLNKNLFHQPSSASITHFACQLPFCVQQLLPICSARLCLQHNCLSSASAAYHLLQVACCLQGRNGALGVFGPVSGPIS